MLPGWAQWSSRALLVLLAAVAVRLGFSERGGRGRHEMTSAHTIALVMNIVLFGAYWLTLAIASPTVGHLSVFGPVVNVLLGSLALALYPFLQVAAVDFGEWGQTTVERVGAAIAKTEVVTRILAFLLGVGVIVYGYQHAAVAGVLSSATLYSVARGVLVVTIGWSVLCLVGRVLKLNGLPWSGSLGFAPLVAVCAMLTIVIVPLAGLINGNFVIRTPELVTPDGHFAPGSDVVTQVSLGPAGPFSVLLPRPWITVNSSNGSATGLAAHAPVEPGRAEIVIVTDRQGTSTLSSLAAEAAVQTSLRRAQSGRGPSQLSPARPLPQKGIRKRPSVGTYRHPYAGHRHIGELHHRRAAGRLRHCRDNVAFRSYRQLSAHAGGGRFYPPPRRRGTPQPRRPTGRMGRRPGIDRGSHPHRRDACMATSTCASEGLGWCPSSLRSWSSWTSR